MHLKTKKQTPKLSFLETDSSKTKIFYFVFALAVVLSHLVFMQLYYGAVTFVGMKYLHFTQQDFLKYTDLFDAISFLFLFVIYFALFRFFFPREKREPPKWKTWGISHLFGWAAAGISCLWFLLLDHVLSNIPFIAESLKAFNQGMDSIMGGGTIGFFLATILFAPVVEEILFRGLVMNALEKAKGPAFAIIGSALLFGIWHGIFIQSVYTFFLGLFAGFLYYKKRNIMYPITVHFVNNFLSILGVFLVEEYHLDIVDPLSIVLIVPAIYIVIKMIEKSKKEKCLSQ